MISKIASLNATVLGTGPKTVVFANGLGTSQKTWRHQVAALQDECRLVLFDFVGTPDSDLTAYRPERYDSIYAHADDAIALLDELDVSDVTFVGHSVGGMVGVLTALAEPDRVTDLVLIAASPRYLDDGKYVGGASREMVDAVLASATADYHAWVSGFSPLIIGDGNAEQFVQEFDDSLKRMRPDVASQTLKTIFLSDLRDVLPKVQQHVTVIQPRADHVVPVAVGEYMAAHFPSAELQILETVGHVPHLTAPDQITRILRVALGLSEPALSAD